MITMQGPGSTEQPTPPSRWEREMTCPVCKLPWALHPFVKGEYQCFQFKPVKVVA